MALLSSLVMGVAYWKDPRIHQLGNYGPKGRIHASLANAATRAINLLSYDGKDIRKEVIQTEVEGAEGGCVDLGCGVGFSTQRGGIGVDESPAMLWQAENNFPSTTFERGNAETWGEEDMCGVCSLFFVLHEAPFSGRQRILENAVRIAGKRVVVLDIAPEKTPSKWMLEGEPYLTEYLVRIQDQIQETAIRKEMRLSTKKIVEGRATCWVLEHV